MPSVLIHRCSSAAAKLLRRDGAVVGRVHSRYARVLNVCTRADRLLTLQGAGQLQAPLALSLAGEGRIDLPRLPIGTLVMQALPGATVARAALGLIWSDAREWDGRIRPAPGLTPATLSRRADELATWMVQHVPAQGLTPLLSALPGDDSALSPVCRRAHHALRPLLTGGCHATPTLLETASQMLGLGEGLTPSGDDLLVGLLAVLHAGGRARALLPPPARREFLQDVAARTSDLSAEFLRSAVHGDFAEPVVLLVRSLFAAEPCEWRTHARALAAVGHSSGVDAMVGMALASHLL